MKVFADRVVWGSNWYGSWPSAFVDRWSCGNPWDLLEKAVSTDLRPEVPNLWELMPDALRWSWCHNERNKCTRKVSCSSHHETISPFLVPGKIVFHKTDAKKVGDRCFRQCLQSAAGVGERNQRSTREETSGWREGDPKGNECHWARGWSFEEEVVRVWSGPSGEENANQKFLVTF